MVGVEVCSDVLTGPWGGGQVDRLRVESPRAGPQAPAGHLQATLPPRAPSREAVGTEVRDVGLETAGVRSAAPQFPSKAETSFFTSEDNRD